ncbi:C-myc promoter-binding protein [Dissostichus eleginoides]|uniref:C-myc promoter-binding protein n=1 Tax=Dissostichus eleginoides TaxID=100907 RepID=A0AAD9EX95_DISEL|nr:C-myc promoter-binding protein [Dissostichus eleginoides]
MSTYISELDVSLNAAEEQMLQSDGFNKINVHTKVQVSFNEDMAKGLTKAGYIKIDKDLNAGAGCSPLHFWYSKGSGEFETPIVDISVTTDGENEAAKFDFGWERVDCDLNRKAEGNWIHVWLKREEQTYICDLTATDSYGSDSDHFQNGYIRVDEDTNRGAGGSYVFIWYRQTTDPKKALKDLKVSITDSQRQQYQQQEYQPVSVNLNEGTGGQKVYMWYKKEGSNKPIKTIALMLNTALVPDYQKAGVTVIQRNLNTGTKGFAEYLCVID